LRLILLLAPFAGLCLADYGAAVLRVDRPHPLANSPVPPPPTPDLLARGKSSIAVNIKSSAGLSFIKALITHVDVVIDPFRPNVLENAGLGPSMVLIPLNPRLIVARLTGFRRDGKYTRMAGHDINYIAASGVLSMLGRKHEKPYAPGNLLADFAGGGAMCFAGILLALLDREKTGHGRIVEVNMVDGSAYLATWLRLATKTPIWDSQRGENLLDGGCPWYDTYETKDGGFMAVWVVSQVF
jgi:alpha-methylacyl-CoA racemase